MKLEASTQSPARVTIFTNKNCQPCTATKRALKLAGVPFIEVDVDHNEKMAEVLRNKGVRSLPVIQVDGEVEWSGYRPELIEGLAKRLA